MKRARCFLCLAVAGLLCAGCYPLRVTTSPGASGIVLDANSLTPISGAEAAVLEWNWQAARNGGHLAVDSNAPPNARAQMAVTQADGRFSIPAEHEWIRYSPSPAMMPAAGELAITRQGYEPATMYLTDDPKLAVQLVGNPAALAAKLKAGADPLSAWLIGRFPEPSRKIITNYPASRLDDRILQSLLTKNLEAIIAGPLIYENQRFDKVELSPATARLLEFYANLGQPQSGDAAFGPAFPRATAPGTMCALLNRKLLEDAYPRELSAQSIGLDCCHENVGVVLLNPLHH